MTIRPEKYQYNWKPRYAHKTDTDLVKTLEIIRKKLGKTKLEITREALCMYATAYHRDQTTKGLMLDLDKYDN